MNTGIFRCALPFVYGLIKFSQKPERWKYTDTIREFERRAPNHYRERRKEVRPATQDRPENKGCIPDPGQEATVQKIGGQHHEESLPCKAGPSSL
ncbi:MAG TPA: hypothetical protein VL091_06900 [Marinobacter sp.]|nr:hypothetical protein [Marinobacter sp.]